MTIEIKVGVVGPQGYRQQPQVFAFDDIDHATLELGNTERTLPADCWLEVTSVRAGYPVPPEIRQRF